MQSGSFHQKGRLWLSLIRATAVRNIQLGPSGHFSRGRTKGVVTKSTVPKTWVAIRRTAPQSFSGIWQSATRRMSRFFICPSSPIHWMSSRAAFQSPMLKGTTIIGWWTLGFLVLMRVSGWSGRGPVSQQGCQKWGSGGLRDNGWEFHRNAEPYEGRWRGCPSEPCG